MSFSFDQEMGEYSGGILPPPPHNPLKGHVKFNMSQAEKAAEFVDMGFDPKAAQEALVITNNKFEDALQLLMDQKEQESKWQDIPKDLLKSDGPPKPAEMTKMERQTTEEQIEEIEFQTKKRKFEENREERHVLLKHQNAILEEVKTIYERCISIFQDPPDAPPEELLKWYQTKVHEELNQQREYIMTLRHEIKSEESNDELAAQKMKLEEIDYNDTKLAREYDQTQMNSGIRMSLEDRNIRYLKDHNYKKKFDCEICLCEYSVKEILVLECGHFWCLNCVRRFLDGKIEAGQVQGIDCLNPECDYILVHEDVRLSVTPDMLDKYDRFLVEGHLRKDPDCKWCPKPDCNTAMLRNKKSPMMECPTCKFRFCFNCETEEWHNGVTCKQFQDWKIANGEADKRFDNWQSDHSKRCPKCNTNIEKNGGCDHMTCTQCRHEWYWSTGLKYP